MTEGHPSFLLGPRSVVVGSAMNYPTGHLRENIAASGAFTQDSCQATHGAAMSDNVVNNQGQGLRSAARLIHRRPRDFLEVSLMVGRGRILITGGTGFLGKRLALTLKGSNDVFLAGRNNGQNMVAADETGCPVIPMDVARIEAVRDAIIEIGPNVIIHAAATKYVDVAENQPLECTDINVAGSANVARIAMERGVQTVIGVSTDKAAPPVRNTYALTKALMERIYCSLDGKSDTHFACVRFGNLAWSTGSVLPIWKSMLERDGIIGTTGPEMRRFFIRVDEAVDLILAVIANIDSLHGTVVTRHMKAVLIGDLLNEFVAVHGGSWKKIGGRPGERDDEYLVGDLELPYTSEREIGGKTHYVIDFNRLAETKIATPLSSAESERLDRAELRELVRVKSAT